MKPVNLLPSDLRGAPKASTAISARTDVPRGPGAFIVLGVLAFAVLALAGYVVTTNSIKDRQSQLAQLEARQQAAQRRTAALAPYAQFDQLAKQRVATVRDLAGQRFDWDQTLRDLSRALPGDVSIKNLTGSVTGGGTSGGAASSPGAVASPSITLTGCTRSQSSVARLMSRLSNVNGVTHVTLGSSEKSASESATPAVGQPATDGPLCGSGSRPDFSIVIHFERSQAAAAPAATAGQPATGTQGAATAVQPTPTAAGQPAGGAQASTGGTTATAATATSQGGAK